MRSVLCESSTKGPQGANLSTKSNRPSARSWSSNCNNILDDLYRKATVESPYLPESQTKSSEKGEPASSMNDPSINLVPLDPFGGFNLPERAAHRNHS